LLPDENWSFDPDGSETGVLCGLEDVEILDD